MVGWIVSCAIKSHVILFVGMSSTLSYIVLGMFIMIYIGSKHIRIWKILDIVGVVAIFSSLWHGLHMKLFLSNFCILFWTMHWQQQECLSCNFVLKILCIHTMVNYFYCNICTHNHISLNLWCLYCCELSSLLFECDDLHVDEIVFVLQLVEWFVYFIKSVCGMYELIFAYLLSFSFFHVCLYVIFLCSIFHFSHFLSTFWENFE